MHHINRLSAKTPNVAIIGAGFSGLRCADVLHRSGAKVTVFEARNRIGGRVNQVSSGGYLMDMGANWIHGTNGNAILKLAEQTGTVIMEPEEDQAVFDAGGSRKSDEEAAELTSTLWGMVVKAFKYSDENSAAINAETSLMDYFKQELPKQFKDKRKLEDMLKEAQMWGPFVGDPIETQSLKFFFLEECIDGENVFVASTYRRILEEVGRTPTGAGLIQFNTEVRQITRDKGSDGSSSVKITMTDGTTQAFDEVVVTCPLGWLKRNKQAFSPSLPSRLSQAIDNIK